ncbi:MAG: Rad52/Rad22 family DNA repair protein [Desulfurobacteriaceae bacterium]
MVVETIKNQTITGGETMNETMPRTELFAGLDYWNEVVQRIDEILDKEGASAVQEVPARGGRTLYGYKPQSVLDALNRTIGANNWGYQILDYNITPVEVKGKKEGETQIRYLSYVRIRLWIFDPATAKEAFGGSENYSPGDSLKGAVTDAIQKCLSIFSIGRKAYRGELHELFKDKKKGNGNGNHKASEKQIALIKKLAKETGATIKVDFETITAERASKLIEKLLAKKKELEAKDSIDEISNVEF